MHAVCLFVYCNRSESPDLKDGIMEFSDPLYSPRRSFLSPFFLTIPRLLVTPLSYLFFLYTQKERGKKVRENDRIAQKENFTLKKRRFLSFPRGMNTGGAHVTPQSPLSTNGLNGRERGERHKAGSFRRRKKKRLTRKTSE